MAIKDIFPHNSPKITIVTVSLNQRDFLEKCIDSLFSQDYPNLDYHILDGGSTDGSVDLIKRHQHRLASWRSGQDDGAYAAVDEGLRRSSGEIMGWLNSDDMMHPNGLHILAHAFDSNRHVSWITGERVGFNIKGAIQSFGAERQVWPREVIIDEANFAENHLFTIMQEGTFWRRALWDRAGGGLDLSYKLAADFELWARFSRYQHLYTVNQKIGGFRDHGETQRSKAFRGLYVKEAHEIITRERSFKSVALEPIPVNKRFLILPTTSESVTKRPPNPAPAYSLSVPIRDLPTTTIVTQCCNHALVIERCIDSVLSAGIPNLEFIVIDQGSSDGSQDIIKKYSRYMSRWETFPRANTFEALNRGFQSSHGAVMGWIDPHAIIFKERFHSVLRAFLTNPKVSWLSGLPSSLGRDGELSWVLSRLPLYSRATVCFTNWEEPWVFPESTYWTRPLWQAAGGGFDVRWQFAGELDLWRRFFRFAQLYSLHTMVAAAEREYALHDKLMSIYYRREANSMMEEEYQLIQKGMFPTVVPAPEPLKEDYYLRG